MSSKEFLALIAILTTTLTTLTLAAVTTSFTNSAFAQGAEKFVADLSVSQVVPPIDSKATGNAEFESNTDRSSISYIVNVTDINAVKAAHIHIGEIGQNGDVIVTLFKSETPTGQLSWILSK